MNLRAWSKRNMAAAGPPFDDGPGFSPGVLKLSSVHFSFI